MSLKRGWPQAILWGGTSHELSFFLSVYVVCMAKRLTKLSFFNNPRLGNGRCCGL